MRPLVLTALLALAGCAHLKNDETVCPEYRDLHCLTAPECTLDRARGCEVCRCAPPPYAASAAPVR